MTQKQLLNLKIRELENKQLQEFLQLKIQGNIVVKSFNPLVLLKKLFTDSVSSPELKNNLLNNAIGLATGFISRKLIFGGSANPLKVLLGNALQFLLGNVVARNADTIKSAAENILKKSSKNGIHSNEEYPDEYIY